MFLFFFDDTNHAATWEAFEKACSEFLNREFGYSFECLFTTAGGHNPKAPDINVIRNGKRLFSIEAKMSEAQCGQFVLIPDDRNRTFIFSPNNKCRNNRYVRAIIAEMEKSYEQCKNSPHNLPIPENLIYNWVKDYYANQKGSKYFITADNAGNFIIIPVNKLEEYFVFTAKYRNKRSGSKVPSLTCRTEIETTLDNHGIKHSPAIITGTKAFIDLDCTEKSLKLNGNKYRYLFKNIGGNRYEIKQLANTNNSNFIVSISLKSAQRPEDLDLFCYDLARPDSN